MDCLLTFGLFAYLQGAFGIFATTSDICRHVQLSEIRSILGFTEFRLQFQYEKCYKGFPAQFVKALKFSKIQDCAFHSDASDVSEAQLRKVW